MTLVPDQPTAGGRMTDWQFLRWYVANHHPVQRGMVAATMTVTAVAVACWPVLGASPLHGWADGLADGASLLLYATAVWLMLGSCRVQEWITGDNPAGPGRGGFRPAPAGVRCGARTPRPVNSAASRLPSRSGSASRAAART
jgi:hypothetical protein